MLRYTLFVIVLLASIACNKDDINNTSMENVNNTSTDRMLLVLSVPSVNNDYYKEVHQQIVDFQINYAKIIMSNDNVIVVADAATMPLLEGKLPDDVLMEETLEDIWMRDFTTVIPSNPVQFNYRPNYFNDVQDAVFIQNAFNNFAGRYGVSFRSSGLILDGGNIVDNNKDAVITTTRFLEDNNLTEGVAKEELKQLLEVDYVAIIPYDDDVMGHSDGMVMFTDDRTVLVNRYDEEPLKSTMKAALEKNLPGFKIVEVESAFEDVVWRDFSSACGVNLNSTVTHNNIYVPVFNNSIDGQAVNAIKANTNKKVFIVPANNVCKMGGSVRCLTWQLQGDNANKLIAAAKNR